MTVEYKEIFVELEEAASPHPDIYSLNVAGRDGWIYLHITEYGYNGYRDRGKAMFYRVIEEVLS